MKIKIVCLEIKFPWEKTKTKNQKQFLYSKANVAFFIKKLKRYLTVLKSSRYQSEKSKISHRKPIIFSIIG